MKTHNWTFLCQSFEKTMSMAGTGDFIYCDPPYIGRHVDYYDRWDEESEVALSAALKKTGAKFMLSTWDHNAYRQNEYIRTVWSFCQKATRQHFYHVGAREENRNPMVEALLTNYAMTGDKNLLSEQRPMQLALAL